MNENRFLLLSTYQKQIMKKTIRKPSLHQPIIDVWMGKHFLFSILFALIAVTTMAQSEKGAFSIRPMAGVNLSDFSGGVSDDFYHMKAGLAVGLEAEYGISRSFSLSLGAFYSQMGAKVDGTLAVMAVNDEYMVYIETKDKGKVTCNYITLPLMANFYVPAVKGLALKVGAQMGILASSRMKADVDARTETSLRSEPTMPPTTTNEQVTIDQDTECKSLDFGIPFGLSYEHKNVVVDLRYYFGLTKIDDSATNREDIRNRCLTLTLGYRLPL